MSRTVTLAIGLTISSVLYTYIAYFLNTNTYFGDYQNLYTIYRNLETKDYKYNGNIIFAPIPAALKAGVPEIEYATFCTRAQEGDFFYNENKYNSTLIIADSCFFETMGITVIDGDSKLLGQPNHIFLSDKQAEIIFNQDNPVGKQIFFNSGIPYTIAGIFKSISPNSTLRFEAVLSSANLKTQFNRYCGWNGGDSYQGYVRLSPNISAQAVSKKIDGVLKPYLDADEGAKEEYSLVPIIDLARKGDNTPAFLFLLNLLATIVLFVAAFNYILAVLSTLPLRIRPIGVLKSFGASRFDIFKQFLVETGFVIFAALCLTLLLIYIAHIPIETFTGLSLSALFALDNLWLPFLTLLVVTAIASIIPGIILARSPIQLFFSAKTEHNQLWKKVLLFIQITGAAIILPLLVASFIQYNYMVNKPLGYEPDGIVYVNLRDQLKSAEELTPILSRFKSMPFVKSVGTGEDYITGGYSGNPIIDEQKNTLFITRVTWFDSHYVPTLGIKIVEGRNIKGYGEVVVNETFAKKISPNESLIGKTVSPFERFGPVVGIMADYSFTSLYHEMQPMLGCGIDPTHEGLLILRISEITPERLKELNSVLRELITDPEIEFTVQNDDLLYQYESAKQFRNIIGYTTLAILIIVFIGLLGYINNEISRKSKEIAIRKINGASVWNILKIICVNLSYALVPAILAGSIAAHPIVQYWMQQFAYKATISWLLYTGTGVAVFVVIILCTLFKSWHIANGNPIKHLKQE